MTTRKTNLSAYSGASCGLLKASAAVTYGLVRSRVVARCTKQLSSSMPTDCPNKCATPFPQLVVTSCGCPVLLICLVSAPISTLVISSNMSFRAERRSRVVSPQDGEGLQTSEKSRRAMRAAQSYQKSSLYVMLSEGVARVETSGNQL